MEALKAIEEKFEKLFVTLGYPDFIDNNISNVYKNNNINKEKLHYFMMLRVTCLSILRTGFVEVPEQKKISVFDPSYNDSEKLKYRYDFCQLLVIFMLLGINIENGDDVIKINDVKYNRLLTIYNIIN
jgi:hypothetical protein